MHTLWCGEKGLGSAQQSVAEKANDFLPRYGRPAWVVILKVVDGAGLNLKTHGSKTAHRARHVVRGRDQNPPLPRLGLQEPKR